MDKRSSRSAIVLHRLVVYDFRGTSLCSGVRRIYSLQCFYSKYFIHRFNHRDSNFSIALGRRITNLKLAQDKLNASLITKNQELNSINESLDSFNYHVSHDLKTVLNNTIALTRMIKKYNGLNDSKKVGEISEKLEKLAINGNETVQSFLSIGRIDSLLREDQNESIDVNDEIKNPRNQ